LLTKRDKENYVEIDHRDSPGLTAAEAAWAGWEGVPLGKGSHLKAAVITCTNCQKQLIRNPFRIRERFYCQKCDGYHCDDCALVTRMTGVCKPFAQFIMEYLSAVASGKPVPELRKPKV
jgi:hypothetical protein